MDILIIVTFILILIFLYYFYFRFSNSHLIPLHKETKLLPIITPILPIITPILPIITPILPINPPIININPSLQNIILPLIPLNPPIIHLNPPLVPLNPPIINIKSFDILYGKQLNQFGTQYNIKSDNWNECASKCDETIDCKAWTMKPGATGPLCTTFDTYSKKDIQDNEYAITGILKTC